MEDKSILIKQPLIKRRLKSRVRLGTVILVKMILSSKKWLTKRFKLNNKLEFKSNEIQATRLNQIKIF